MNRVFVSYSRKDRNFAERLARDLSDAGLDVWIDFRQIHAGEVWQDEIFRGIQRADMVLVALSPDAVASSWVQREVNTAREQEKMIIPVMAVEALQDVQRTPELSWLETVHFIRFYNRYEDAFRELLDALPGKRTLGAFDDLDPANIPNPFKGLEAFQQTDFRFFFGREDLIRKALNSLVDHQGMRFLAVVGASGSGKSSIVRAGVIPQLRQGKLPKSESWRTAIFTPGTDPVEALATRLAPLLGENFSAESVTAHLHRDVENLNSYAEMILGNTSPEVRLLLVIDQFEEVFTRATEENREQFLNLLYDAATHENGRAQVLLTMRADFFDRLGRYPQFAELFEQDNLIIVTEMTASNLLRTIEGPARAVGLVYEDGLVDRILDDVRRQPGSLPLLQYALKALYDRRNGRYLTHAAYDAIGGVDQALARHAEEVYTELNAAQQDIMRRVLLRLVEVPESGDVTRRRVPREDLAFQGVAPEVVQEILDVMTAAESRLLIASREIKTRDDVSAPVTWFEVSHEALIREWDRLKDWIDENLEDLRHSAEILKAANDWNQAGRDNAYLLVGTRLLRAELWVQNADANSLQREFIRASMEQRSRAEIARQEQAERELLLQKQAADRLRGFVGVLVLGLIVAIGLTVFAFSERNRAEENQRLAQISAAEASSFGLSSVGERALSDGDNELAVALVVEAARILDNPPPQTRLTLSNVVYAPGTRLVLPHIDDVNTTSFLPGGEFAVSGAADGSLFKWDLTTGETLMTYTTNVRRVTALGVDHLGRYIVSGSNSGRLILWDVNTGEQIRQFAQEGTINAIVFSPDDTTLLSASGTGSLYLWDVATGVLLKDLQGHTDNVTNVVYHPSNPNLAVSSSWDRTILVWDFTQPESTPVGQISTDGAILSLDISPNGTQIAAGFRRQAGGTIRLYSLSDILGGINPISAVEFPGNVHNDDVTALTFSPDGTQIASGGGTNDASIVLWNVAARSALLTLNGHTDAIRALKFNPTGTRLISASSDNTLRLWDLNRSEVINNYVGHQERGAVGVYGPGNRTLLSGSYDFTLRLWDTVSGRTMQEFIGHTDLVNSVDLSADGTRAISGSLDETVRVWDVTTGGTLLTLPLGIGGIKWVRFLPGDAQFVVVGEDGNMLLIDSVTGQPVRSFDALQVVQETAPSIESLAVSSDGTLIVTGGSDGVVSLWEVATGALSEQFTGVNTDVYAVAISADNQLIAGGGQNGTLMVWQVGTGNAPQSFEGHDRVILGVAFTSDGSSLLSGAFDYTLRLWDLDSGFEIRRYQLDESELVNFQSLELSDDNGLILTGLTDSSLRLWRLLPTVNDLLVWTFQNRYVPPLTCDQRVLFRLDACDTEGNPPIEEPFPVPPIEASPLSLLIIQPGIQAYINSSSGDSIRLRTEPNNTTNENILTSLADGTQVSVLDGPYQANGLVWWRIRAPGDYEGFVAELLPEENLQILVPVSAFEQLATGTFKG